MNNRLAQFIEGVPTKRITRALASRISKLASIAADLLEDDKKLTCNGCGRSVAQFIRYAGKPNLCPACGAPAKERLVLALIDSGLLEVPKAGRVLHIAPSEEHLTNRFTAAAAAAVEKGGQYIAADLHPRVYRGHDVVELDLTQLASRRNRFGSFDLIYASHVLEHIPDDEAALEAVAASLNPGGEFWMLVPLVDGPTIDGDGTESIRDRERHFGQWDHVRQYGDDLGKRLEAAGFDIAAFGIVDLAAETNFEAGLAADDLIWRCRLRNDMSGDVTNANRSMEGSDE